MAFTHSYQLGFKTKRKICQVIRDWSNKQIDREQDKNSHHRLPGTTRLVQPKVGALFLWLQVRRLTSLGRGGMSAVRSLPQMPVVEIVSGGGPELEALICPNPPS